MSIVDRLNCKLEVPESFAMGFYFRSLRRKNEENGRTRPEVKGDFIGIFDLKEKGFDPVSSVLGKRGLGRYFGF